MNEQEKEFMAFVEWLPKNIKKFANAKPEEIVAYLTKLSETPEGKNEFNALVTEYKKSKQNIPMAQKGSKIDYFVKKFETGGPTVASTLIRKIKSPITNVYGVSKDFYDGQHSINVSDNTGEYNLVTDGKDSTFMWFPGEGSVILRNSGPNHSWTGNYSRGSFESHKVDQFNSDEVNRIVNELRKKLNVR